MNKHVDNIRQFQGDLRQTLSDLDTVQAQLRVQHTFMEEVATELNRLGIPLASTANGASMFPLTRLRQIKSLAYTLKEEACVHELD